MTQPKEKLYAFVDHEGLIKYAAKDETLEISPNTKGRSDTCHESRKNCIIELRQTDFTQNGYIISEDYTSYRLVEDILFINPVANTTTPAITIHANHIKLDLGGFTIKGINAPVGIFIYKTKIFKYGELLNNIDISNGILRNFYRNGILDNGSKNLTISDLYILENVEKKFAKKTMAFGIISNGGLNLSIKNCRIT
ncbi:MAG: hypothetical protein Harvfovirus48_12, partial [Harvfovirus sp.]